MKKYKSNAQYKKLKTDGYTSMVRKALIDKGLYNESLEITMMLLTLLLLTMDVILQLESIIKDISKFHFTH